MTVVYVATNRKGGESPRCYHKSPECHVFAALEATPVGPIDVDHPRARGKEPCGRCYGDTKNSGGGHSIAYKALVELAEAGGNLPERTK